MASIDHSNQGPSIKTSEKDIDDTWVRTGSWGESSRNAPENVTGEPPRSRDHASELDDGEKALEYLKGWRLHTLTFAYGPQISLAGNSLIRCKTVFESFPLYN